MQVFISFASEQVDKILQKTGLRDMARIALAGLGTGALSYAVMMYWPTALQIPFPISLGKYGGAGVSSLPGLLFGALVAFCNWKFGIRDKLHLGVIVAFTLISWVLAVNVTQFTFDYITKYTKSPPALPARTMRRPQTRPATPPATATLAVPKPALLRLHPRPRLKACHSFRVSSA